MKKDRPKKYRLLAYVENALGRDTEILLPIAFTLEKYLQCEVRFAFVWDIYLIRRWKPDVVLLPNIKGHHMYLEIGKYAYENGITVLAHESEGNFKTDGSYNYWGYNTDQIFYQEWVTAWSRRTQAFIQKLKPSDATRVVVTGGTGFDRYVF